MSQARRGERPGHGHRSVPHTADLRIESWGRTREECVAEAVTALVESFADVGTPGRERAAHTHLAGGSDGDLLVAALEEVIYRLDAHGTLPASVEARPAADGGIDLTFGLVSARSAEFTGAMPKAASLSDLHCAEQESGGWRAAVTVDV